MSDLLKSTRAKIKWADTHIRNVEQLIVAYQKDGCAIFNYDDEMTGHRIYYGMLQRPLPEDLPFIVGDAIQNLRSSLDHLACALVRLNSGPDANIDFTQFPITWKLNTYKDAPNRAPVKGMSLEALEIIDELKPYKGGHNDLWQLHRLNQIDKHRVILVCSAFQSSVHRHSLPPILQEICGLRLPVELLKTHDAPLITLHEDPEEICREKLNTARVLATMNLHPKFAGYVALNEPTVADGKPIVQTLNQLSSLVSGIVNQFAPMFG